MPPERSLSVRGCPRPVASRPIAVAHAIEPVAAQDDRAEDEESVRVDPHDLDWRQDPGQGGTTLDAEQDGQEAREEDEREDLRSRVEPRGHEGQRGEPAEGDDPGRPVAAPGGQARSSRPPTDASDASRIIPGTPPSA